MPKFYVYKQTKGDNEYLPVGIAEAEDADSVYHDIAKQLGKTEWKSFAKEFRLIVTTKRQRGFEEALGDLEF
jgi:hypothetical protein